MEAASAPEIRGQPKEPLVLTTVLPLLGRLLLMEPHFYTKVLSLFNSLTRHSLFFTPNHESAISLRVGQDMSNSV